MNNLYQDFYKKQNFYDSLDDIFEHSFLSMVFFSRKNIDLIKQKLYRKFTNENFTLDINY